VDALSEARGKVSSGTPDEAQTLVENELVDLIWFGATTTRIGAALLVMTLGFEAMGTADPELAARTSMRLGVFGGSVLVITALLGAWLVGIVNAVVRHHGFRLRRVEDSLVAEEGLFTRRKVELPVRKVQMVTVVEPWFRRWLGFGSVIVETAAARAGSGGVERALSMVPMSRPEVRPDLLMAALPGLDVDLERVELDPPNRRALARSLIRGSMQGVVLAGLVSWWWWPWGAVSWLLAPLFPVIQWLDWKHQGWKITNRFVVSRRGYLTRTTRVVARQKLQAVDVDAGPLLRRYRLSEVVLRVAGAAVAMPLLDEDRAFAIAARLSETASRARRPAVTVTPEVATRLEAAATPDAG
jgi:putative membrane protein